MKAKSRTILGVLLFLPLAVILLATFACLPAPIGDPETAKVDDALVGAWKGVPADPTDKSTILALLRPWDAHTYFLQYISVEMKDDKETHQMMPMKAWLTTIADATFLVTQPMDDLRFAVGDDGQKPYWPVMRLDKTNAGLDVRPISADSEPLKALTTREQLEAAIKEHVNDKIYGEKMAFKKLGKEDQAMIEGMLGKFNTK